MLRMAIVLTLFQAPSEILAQVQISRSVVGGGAAIMSDGTHALHATLGQVAIGRITSGQPQHYSGFWYTVQKDIDTSRFAALVVVPNTHAAPGDLVSMVLLLQQSKNIVLSGVRSFSAVLKFNATLLEPIDLSQYRRVLDTGWLTVRGDIRDSSQVLAAVEFRAKLGALEATPVEVDSFQFLENTSVTILKKGGVFSLDGVCQENGTLRLIKFVEPTTLAIVPNPATTHVEVRAFIAEKGLTEISIIDMRGIAIEQLFSQELQPSQLQIPVNLYQIPSGSYYLIMRTPNDVFSQKFIIQK